MISTKFEHVVDLPGGKPCGPTLIRLFYIFKQFIFDYMIKGFRKCDLLHNSSVLCYIIVVTRFENWGIRAYFPNIQNVPATRHALKTIAIGTTIFA